MFYAPRFELSTGPIDVDRREGSATWCSPHSLYNTWRRLRYDKAPEPLSDAIGAIAEAEEGDDPLAELAGKGVLLAAAYYNGTPKLDRYGIFRQGAKRQGSLVGLMYVEECQRSTPAGVSVLRVAYWARYGTAKARVRMALNEHVFSRPGDFLPPSVMGTSPETGDLFEGVDPRSVINVIGNCEPGLECDIPDGISVAAQSVVDAIQSAGFASPADTVLTRIVLATDVALNRWME